MAFKYRVYTQDRRILQGVIEAVTEEQAETSLYGAGYANILSLEETRPGVALERLLPTLLGVKTQEVIDFTIQLGTLVGSGVPLLTALRLLQGQARGRALTRTITGLVDEVETGASLSQAMKNHPQAFPETFLQVIRAAEQAGNLDAGLEQAASYLQKQMEATQKIRKAMMYPVFVIVIAIGVVILMTTVALPPLVQLFSSFGADLPWMTKVLISLATFLMDNAALIVMVLAALALLAYVALRTEPVRRLRDGVSLKIPVLGDLIIERTVQKFCQTAAMLLSAGLRLPVILEMLTEGERNRVLKQSLGNVRDLLVQGEGLSEPMSRDRLFPALLVEMIVVGEKTGELDSVLNTLARFYERKVERRVDLLVSLIEPALTVVIGAIVIFIALSMITPLYSVLRTML